VRQHFCSRTKAEAAATFRSVRESEFPIRRLLIASIGFAVLVGLSFGALYGELDEAYNWIYAAVGGAAFFVVMGVWLRCQRR
jgi:hypothetical protein